jgi:hypothetical protein
MKPFAAGVAVSALAALVVGVVITAPAPPANYPPSFMAGGNMIAGVARSQAADRATDIAYMRLHPAPERPGFTPGIITSVVQHDHQCAAPSGVRTTVLIEPGMGDPPCITWVFTIVTVAGKTLRASCGSQGHPCKAPDNVLPGDEGEYLWVPSDGKVSPAAPVLFLGCWTAQRYPCPFEARVVSS